MFLRYLFYYERYFNHKESKRVAGKQLAATEDKMSKLVSEGMHFMQVEFLKSATQLVLQCRRVLSWSYAHAFYITDKGVKTLFEFRQSELEQVGTRALRVRRRRCLSRPRSLCLSLLLCLSAVCAVHREVESADRRFPGAASSRSTVGVGLDARAGTIPAEHGD